MRLTTILLIIVVLSACDTDSAEPKEIVLDLPSEPYEYFGDANVATLGRVLFYDTKLSINNAISCASCHKQEIAFSDNKQFSRGFENRSTTRNSMPIQNLGNFFRNSFGDSFISPGFSTGLFWDGRGVDQANAVLFPIINHVEMGIPNLQYLEEKLNGIDYYDELFSEAFGTEEVTKELIGTALHAFLVNITSNETKLDKFIQEEAQLSAKEIMGAELFISKYQCNNCHQVESPSGYIFAGLFANIGLEKEYADSGLESTTNQSFDAGRFKIPSLRNVVLTGPYMHDGRFETLEEVINHYKDGVEDHPNLDPRLRSEDGSPIQFEITDSEVSAIIAFLGTLTDENMLTDERFSNPFKVKE